MRKHRHIHKGEAINRPPLAIHRPPPPTPHAHTFRNSRYFIIYRYYHQNDSLEQIFIMCIIAKSGTLLLIAAFNSSEVPGAEYPGWGTPGGAPPTEAKTHSAYLPASGHRHTYQSRYTRLISDYLST